MREWNDSSGGHGFACVLQCSDTQDTGIPVRTVDMVTTSLVLETVRKVSVLGTDLDWLYESFRSNSLSEVKSRGQNVAEADDKQRKAVVVTVPLRR